MVDKWEEMSIEATECFIVVSNFSGDMRPIENFRVSLDQILSRAANRPNTMLWLEPNIANLKKSRLKQIGDEIRKTCPWFKISEGQPNPVGMLAEYKIVCPIKSDVYPSDVIIHQYYRSPEVS